MKYTRTNKILALFLLLSQALFLFESVQAQSPKKVVLLLPVSGPLADWGEAMRRGAEIALEPQDGKIVLQVEDTQMIPKVGLSVFEKVFTDVQKPAAMIVFGSNVSIAIASQAETRKLLTISIATSDDIQRNKKFVFRHMMSADDTAAKLIPEIERRHYSRIAAISTTQDGMLSYQRSLMNAIPTKIVFSQDIPASERDLSQIALRVVQSGKIDAVYNTLLPPQASLLAKELQRLGYKGEMFAANQVEAASEFANAGSAFEKLWYVKDGNPSSDFDKKFLSKWGVLPENFASNAYDVVNILKQSFQTEDPRLFIESLKDFDGAVGHYSARPDHSFSIPGVLKVVHEGKASFLN